MDSKEEQRGAIKFCYNAGFSASDTVELVQKAYSDSAPSRTTVSNGSNVFEREENP